MVLAHLAWFTCTHEYGCMVVGFVKVDYGNFEVVSTVSTGTVDICMCCINVDAATGFIEQDGQWDR